MRTDVIDLQVLADDTFLWNGQRISGEMLSHYLEAAAAQNPQPEVKLRPDPYAKYNAVVRVLADVQRAGLQKVGFVGLATYRNSE
jgi:biopolymer transport protein ExbD